MHRYSDRLLDRKALQRDNMAQCPKCGRHLTRAHRKSFEKLVYTDIFRCASCGYRLGSQRPFLLATVKFVFSRQTHCIRCGTSHVQRSSKRDRIDSVSRNLLSRILYLSGAPVNKCIACRLQYYDWRKPSPDSDPSGGRG